MELNKDKKEILSGIKMLIVDDEPDVLEELSELFSDSKADLASSYEEAVRYLENNTYDVAILDIMGVRGYDLLGICTKKKIPAVMLTGKAVTKEDLVESLKRGAILFLPKEYMSQLDVYVAEFIGGRKERKPVWKVWLERLDEFLKRLIGVNYREEHKDLWDKLLK